jgi:hypothetical protein
MQRLLWCSAATITAIEPVRVLNHLSSRQQRHRHIGKQRQNMGRQFEFLHQVPVIAPTLSRMVVLLVDTVVPVVLLLAPAVGTAAPVPGA